MMAEGSKRRRSLGYVVSAPSNPQKQSTHSSRQLRRSSSRASGIEISSSRRRRSMLTHGAGWLLGSSSDVQVPRNVCNHLSSTLLLYVKTTGRVTSAENLLLKLRSRDPEVASLLAEVYLLGNEEVKAVRLLHEAVQVMPMDYALLNTQAYFCKLKGENDLALELAKRSVIAAPSEYRSWHVLTEMYISRQDWPLALRSLNGSPML